MIIAVLAGVGVVMLVCSGVLVALLLPAVFKARQAARRMESVNSLKQIAFALHNYHDTYANFPAAYIPNDDGSPRTSWRASILPFIEQEALFEQYDYNVNWDAPANASNSTIAILTYHSSASVEPPTTTNIFMLTSPGALGEPRPNGRFPRLSDCRDGTANTIMIIEVEGLNVPWSEPRDISLQELLAMVDSGQVGPHDGGFNVAMCDGSVHFIGLDIDRQTLSDLVTRDDGNDANEITLR